MSAVTDARPEPVVRVSDYFNLGRKQPSLEFVDVDVFGDTPLFVDPTSLRTVNTEWTSDCVRLVQDFFTTVLQAIRDDRTDRARYLLLGLREPNETHFGVSKGRARGHGVGEGFAVQIINALRESEAVQTGLLRDLEDTVLMIPGIDADIVSDITTNVIREPLIHFTQAASQRYGIPLQEGVSSGPLWDPATGQWHVRYEELPLTDFGKLILVPKIIVRDHLTYRPDDYFFNFILEFLRNQEINAGSSLVQLLRDGSPRVTKRDLVSKYGKGKRVALEVTLKHPEILKRYRASKAETPAAPLDHPDFTESTYVDAPEWRSLLSEIQDLRPGAEHANLYHRNVEKLLSPLFYPSLTSPRIEERIHAGRKRIDITYDNIAQHGFFWWLANNYRAPQIFVECKNYSADPGNLELDQLSGRFSANRGQFGLLICRTIEDKQLFMRRCRDTADDGRGFVIAIDDRDIRELVADRTSSSLEFQLLRERFRKLIN